MTIMGILYVVATPIGNLEDISIRAMKILSSVDGIACEDTRNAGILLKILRQKYPEFYAQTDQQRKEQKMLSYFEHNEQQRIPMFINALKNGLSIALISDAGTPAVSDPGFRLIRECIANGIRVESIPGPSSVISALVVSGLPTDKFLFLGYPPHKGGKRLQLYNNLRNSQEYVKATTILFESPHKIINTLEELREVFGDIEIVICRELTKIHEEVKKKSIAEWLGHFKKITPKGEFVLLFHAD